jgi:hypothetical protein
MTHRRAILLLLAVAIVATMGSTGCRRVRLEDVEGPAGLETATKSVALDGAEKLDARMRMAAGEFKLAGGATGAMDAQFETSPRNLLPEVDYSVEGTSGVLRVTQPTMEEFDFMGDTRNVWDVKLASGIPVDLDVEFGAGDSTVDLSEVDVRDVHVLTGAGKTTIDLTGERTADVRAKVEAGVGELTIKVPSNVGVRITGAQDGIGDFNVDGFSADGDAFVNDAWDSATVKIELRIQRGVGEVTIEQQ